MIRMELPLALVPDVTHYFPLLRKKEAILKHTHTFLLSILFFCLVIGLVLYKVVLFSNLSLAPSFWTIYGLVATVFLLSRIPYAYLHQDDHEKTYASSAYPSVSVIIAAKNERAGIFKTVATCVESRYAGALECIVVDDGSTDGTRDEVMRAQRLYGARKVRLIVFPDNKGKREAMAAGIYEAKHEMIVFVDSDSFLAPDAIRLTMEHFLADRRIGAVSGNTKVENADENLLTKMQSIQYAVSFDIYKASESVHRSVTCCPGCFSAYRKAAILPMIHAWKEQQFLGAKGTFGDDRGLTNFVLQNWDIVYCEKARATTVVPTRFSVYLRQQLRWKKSWIREGIFAGTFMWKKKHPLASAAFYIHFSFPIAGPVLAGNVLTQSIMTHNPYVLIAFMLGFVLLGTIFALFARIYLDSDHLIYMPLFALLFVSLLIWQMPYALLTLRKTHWGTR